MISGGYIYLKFQNPTVRIQAEIKKYYETQIRERREDLFNRLYEMTSNKTYWRGCLRQPEQDEVSQLLEHMSKVVVAKPSDKIW
jgi:hypothetical protein